MPNPRVELDENAVQTPSCLTEICRTGYVFHFWHLVDSLAVMVNVQLHAMCSTLITMDRRLKPQLDDSESEDDYLGSILAAKQPENEDDFSSLSFGALSSAHSKLVAEDQENNKKNRKNKKAIQNSESEDDFFQESTSKSKNSEEKTKKKHKHAPAEASSKKRVSRIREIEGLQNPKTSTLYSDVRFDAALGKADWNRIRKDYAFLDEYRQQEINEMKKRLKDPAQSRKMSGHERQEIEANIKSLQSRLDTLKNRDLSNKILSDHKKGQREKMRKGEQVNPYFLKKSEQRKMIQKNKFDTMKASQREKVMERKRKRRLGREFRELEFRGAE